MKKQKFKSAEEKRRFEENQRSWEQLKEKYGKSKSKTKVDTSSSVLSYTLSNPPGRERVDVPSHHTPGGVASSRQPMMYSGTMVKGVSIVHKSCLQPVFSDQEAKDFAGMRR